MTIYDTFIQVFYHYYISKEFLEYIISATLFFVG